MQLRRRRLADYFLPGVEHLIHHGLPIASAPMPAALQKAFIQRQLAEEVEKLALKSGSATLAIKLEQLEDHPLLKGCLLAFDLQITPVDIQRRVDTFYQLFPLGDLLCFGKLLTSALLTKGDYSRPIGSHKFQLGSAVQDSRWRDVLSGARDDPLKIRKPLAALLDDVAARKGDIGTRLQNIVGDWLKKQKRFDWRYYLIKYECMRSGASGLYYSHSKRMGFDLCMLEKDVMRSYYDDPYITAIVGQSGIDTGEVSYWFGFSDHRSQDARWLRSKGGVNILRPNQGGWLVNPPDDPTQQTSFIKVRRAHGMKKRNSEWILEVPLDQTKGGVCDTRDLIELGSSLLVDLLPLYP